ncbi:SDR family oxidoreductase [Azonexus sp.]|uniref:SDR family oxidoreductase n=1 Tax=Azonexus sp. TaxID=1872668 RepID=UPI0035B406CE
MTQRVFITGASSGIGEALAVYYAAQGARLGLAGRRGAALAALNERLGGGHACYVLDVTDAAALEAAASDFGGRFGPPDIVIASAGVSVGTLSECVEDLAVFRRVMDINVYGMAATFAAFIPAMRAASGERRLVGIASVAGIRGLPGAEAYSASKAATIAYLESLRLEMRPAGIKVVSIVPGYIATPMTAINPYRMPFLMPVDRAAARFARVIAAGKSYAVIPWPMGIVAKLLRLLPNGLYDRLFVNAPRKPRGLAQ